MSRFRRDIEVIDRALAGAGSTNPQGATLAELQRRASASALLANAAPASRRLALRAAAAAQAVADYYRVTPASGYDLLVGGGEKAYRAGAARWRRLAKRLPQDG